MLTVCGNFKTTDSTARAVSRLEYGSVTEKFNPFTRTASSEFVTMDMLHILEYEAGTGKTLFC
jgi:hypothetical protein